MLTNLKSKYISEMNEKQFSSKSTNKKIYCIFGQGNKVDTQKPDEAIKLFTEVITNYFKGRIPNIIMSGRFGQDNKNKMWNFDVSMAGSGHPSNWTSESRGYYCMTNKSIFLFPKDDGFVNLLNDFKANSLRNSPVTKINYSKGF